MVFAFGQKYLVQGTVLTGLSIVKAVRERFDGYRRNPWDEYECGHHYSGTMSSWSLLPALSGYTCNLPKKTMRFAPVINEDAFSCFWSNGKAWGTYAQTRDPASGKMNAKTDVLYGDLEGIQVSP